MDEEGRQWLYDADAVALVYALRNLDAAYQNFFRRVKKGEKPGFPRYKRKGECRDSYRTNMRPEWIKRGEEGASDYVDWLHYSGQFHEVREAPEKGWTPWLTRSTPGTSPRSSSGR